MHVIALPLILSVMPTQSVKDLAVMPLTSKGVSHDVVSILNELLLNEAHAVGGFRVIGASDISAMLGMERMKDAVGCHDTACATEIGGALGVSTILAAQVGVLGDELVVTGKVIDTEATHVVARATVKVANETSKYAGALKTLVARLFGTDLTAPELGLEVFMDAGMDAADFDEFRLSGLPYWVWARDRNQESWLLEISKWAATGMVPLTGVMGLALGDDSDGSSLNGFLIGTAVMYALVAGGLWIWDLMDIDNVPPQLDGLGGR